MDSTDIELCIRESAAIGDVARYPDYTQDRILREANNKLTTVFEDAVVKARGGYWLHDFTFTATVGRNRYRIPPRAVVGGLESVAITSTTNAGVFMELDQVPVNDIQDYEGQTGRQGQPVVYVVSGDMVELVPTPSTAIQVRFQYYIRPSALVAAQNGRNSTTDRGRVTAVNTTARTITVNAIPFDQSQAVPAALTSGVQSIDVVHPDGWHELSLVGATQTFAGLVFTVGGQDDMTDILVGDYVRVADQSDWPALPDDFHRCLCDATAVKLLVELHLGEKAQLLAANNGNDILRFKSLLYPRVRAAPKQVGIMRRSRGLYPFGRFFG